jgi:hypothetical protein
MHAFYIDNDMFCVFVLSSVPTIHVVVNEEILQILRKISNSLRPRERETLVKKYTWDSDDELKRTIDTDRTSLLACILLKEINKTQELVDIGKFIVYHCDIFAYVCLIQLTWFYNVTMFSLDIEGIMVFVLFVYCIDIDY